MSPAFVKWCAVLAIALLAAFLAWRNRARTGHHASLKEEIREKLGAREFGIRRMAELVTQMRDLDLECVSLVFAEGSTSEEMARHRMITRLSAITQKVDAEDAVDGTMSAAQLIDIAVLKSKKLSDENAVVSVQIKRLDGEIEGYRTELRRVDDELSRHFSALQLLTLAAVAVSAFPVPGE